MSERIARLRIELQELEPKIWRRIDMPLFTTLETLHEAIQMTMGWTFSHLWEFDIDGRCYGDPSFREFDDEPPVYKAKGLRLGAAMARRADRFVYVYDYGDNWRHDVIVEEVRDGGGVARLVENWEVWRKLRIVKHSERRCAAAERSLRHETSYGIDVAQSIFR